jgi:AcrR family transcriptional regulator
MSETVITYDQVMSRWDPDAKGRLADAARQLFVEKGFDETTVVDIATRAGLTERTFFRHFVDKREVLFAGDVMVERMIAMFDDVPDDVSPIDFVARAIDDACDAISTNPDWSRMRARIVADHPELHERELAKMSMLASVLGGGLRDRGVEPAIAVVAAEAGVLALRVGYERWAVGPRSERLASTVRVVLNELRDVTAGR